MRLIRLLAVLILLLGTAACGAVEEFAGMVEKQQALSSELSELLGSEAQVGWNWENGQLLDLTIYVEADPLGQKTVRELRDQVLPVVLRAFEEAPQQVRVALAWRPRDS